MFLFVALTSCQKEELSSLSAQEDSSQSKIEVKELFADDITNHYFLQKNLSGLYPPNLLDSPFPNTFPENQAYSAEIINFNDFIVRGNYAIEIDVEYMTTYTFKVEDSKGLLESEFANLIIVEKKDTNESHPLFVQYYNWEEYKGNNEVGLLYSYHLIMEGGEFYPPLSDSNLHTTSKITCEQLEEWFGVPCFVGGALREVVVIGSSSKDPEIEDFPDFGPEHGEGEEDRERISWLEGGTGGTGGLPTHPIDEDPDEENTPCDLLEDIIDKGKIKDELGFLKQKTEGEQEFYFIVDDNGVGEIVEGEDGRADDITLTTETESLWHNHPIYGFNIFSPTDFSFYIQLIMEMTKNNPGNLGSVHFGVVGKDYGYIMVYEGSGITSNPLNPSASYNPTDMDRHYNKLRRENENISEEEIFNIIMDKEYLSSGTLESLGVKLVKFEVDNNGNISNAKNISPKDGGKAIEDDC